MKKLLNELEAYHGSPYDFDKFAVKYLGNGEGAQAHGYGLYFALNPDTGEKYRKKLNNFDGMSEIEYNGKSYELDSIQGILLKGILKSKETFLDTIQAIISDKKWLKTHQNILPKLKKVLHIAQKIKPEKIKKIQGKIILKKGQLYIVEIPELKYFVKEGIPYHKQTKYVQNAIDKCTEDGTDLWFGTEKHKWNDNPNRSMALKMYKAGIKGICYTGSIDGKCVVIFNSKDIKMKNKKFNYIGINDNDENLTYDIDDRTYELNNSSKEIRLYSIKNNPYNIKYIDNPSEEEQLLAYNVRDKGNFPGYPIVKLIKNPCQKLQEITIKENPCLIKYIDNPSEEMQMFAIKTATLPEYQKIYGLIDGAIMLDIKNPSENVQAEAIKNWKNAINFIENPTEKIKNLYKKLYGKIIS